MNDSPETAKNAANFRILLISVLAFVGGLMLCGAVLFDVMHH